MKSDSQLSPSILVVLSDRARGDCDKDTRLFEKKEDISSQLEKCTFSFETGDSVDGAALGREQSHTGSAILNYFVSVSISSLGRFIVKPFSNNAYCSPPYISNHNIIFQSISKDNIESNVILVFHLMFCILFWEHGMGNHTVSDSAFC